MTHQRIDERSAAFGKIIAERLRDEPWMIAHARGNLERWMKSCAPSCVGAFEEWRRVIDGPTDGIIELLTSVDEEAVRLRQSNPFAGVLTPAERNAVIREFAS